MEINNLLLCNNPKGLYKLLSSYSSSTKNREMLIEELLVNKNPFDIDNFKIESNSVSNVMKIFKNYLFALGLKLDDKIEI